MAVLDPVRLDHVKRVLRGVVRDAVGDDVPDAQVGWTEKGIPRAPRPYVALTLLEGPESDALKDESVRACEITSVDVSVLSATVGEFYRVRVNGIPFDHVAVGGDTMTTVRDALIALVNNTVAPITKQSDAVAAAADVGPGDFIITPTAPGGIYDVVVEPLGLLTRVINQDLTTLTTHVIGRDRMLFSVDVVTVGGADTSISQTSRMLARRITKSFDLPSSIEKMSNARVPLRVLGTTRNLSGLEPGGAKFESRAQFDVLGFVSSRIAESTVPIESTEVTVDISGNTETFTVTF